MEEPSKKDKELLDLARERYDSLQTEQNTYRQDSLEDIKFTYNIEDGQWDAKDREDRNQKRRPCLTHNKLRKFVAQVANQERDNRIALKAKGIDDLSDPIIADIYTGYMHSIEYQSKADIIYAEAGEQALAGGFGYWRILTKYTDDSFNQDIYIEHIENPFSVYLDPKRNYGFIRKPLKKKEFEKQYPKAQPIDFDLQSVGEEYELWYEDDKIFIAEYFYKEPYERTLAEVIKEGDIDGHPEVVELTDKLTPEILVANGFKILRTRKADSHKVKWCKISGHEVLEREDWAGKEIPIIEVEGDHINISGKVYKRSLIRDGKDPQRMYNYWLTSLTEKVALAPKAPYLLTTEQVKGHQKQWDDANVENYPYLLYNPSSAGVPKRAEPPNIDSGAMAMLNIGDRDISDGLGMYESSFGQKSNERTGKAIIARSSRSDMGIYHFPDNLRRAILETGRQLIDIIPKIVDTQRLLRIRDYEGAESLMEVNQVIVDDDGNSMILNDLSAGKYDIESDVRIWSTRREETAIAMRETMQYAPEIAPLIVDLVFKYSDLPGAQEIEERVKQYLQNKQEVEANKSGGQVPQQGGLQ
jgi:hypothetical protein